MQRFPGVIHLEPDDLGFNAVTIPAATTVNGKIVGALAQCRFDSVEVLAVRTGLSVTTAIDVFQSVDGANVIGAGITPVSAITGTTGCYGYFDGTNALSVGGLTVAAASRFAFYWPFIRISLRNVDGANACVVTLHLFLNLRDEHSDR